MRSRRRLALLFGIVLLPLPTIAAEESLLSASPFKAMKTLEQADQLLNGIKEQIWRFTQSSASPIRDTDGHLLTDDLSEFVLTEAILSRYAQLHATAESQLVTRPTDSSANLEPLRDLLYTEFMRIVRLAGYSSWQDARRYHLEAIEALLRVAPERDSKSWRAELERVDARFRTFRAATPQMALTTDRDFDVELQTWASDVRDINQAFNKLRLDFLSRLQETVRNSLGASVKDRQTACPAAPARTDNGPMLRLLTAPNVDEYYPDLMRRYEVGGVVKVEVEVSETGCVLRAKLAVTSAAPELDEAALDVALLMQFLAPVHDGVATKSGGIVPIRFQMLN
jgi:TonB family protein